MESLLAAYASGTLSPALHALVGAHLELSAENRDFVATLEDALTSSLEACPCGAVMRRDARLDAIFAQVRAAPAAKPSAPPACDPKSLVHFLKGPVDAQPFRTILPGVREARIATGNESRAMLYRIRAGKRMPQHTHEGNEITLVLRGSFHDDTGSYRRGDIAMTDEHTDHTPVAGEEEDCVCFAVIDAPLRLTGPILRLFNRFLRH